MSEQEEKTPRAVYVRVGVPEEMRESGGAPVEEGVNLDELFLIDFAEEGGEEGHTAFAACLCTLAAATEAWLMGGSHEEVKAAMVGHTH